jgi:membrane-associated phospholipid phosphatase
MPLLLLLAVAIAAGTAVAMFSLWASRARPGAAAARKAGEALDERPRLRAIDHRLDPTVATGMALTVALVVAVGGGVVLALLSLLIRSDTDLVRLDRSVAEWGDTHASPFTHDVLAAISYVGRPSSMAVLAVVFVVVETTRTRDRWIAPFLLLVLAGNGIITTTIKDLADRVRPDFEPLAATLGPSFPSGHSSWSAAFLAAAALVLSRERSRGRRAALAGTAAALAASVGVTRVLLDEHWLSDVIAGLAVGWAWFAVCCIAFGGRILRFGATAEELAKTQPGTTPAAERRNAERPRAVSRG